MLDATYQKDNNSNMLDGWVNQVWHNSNQMLIGGDVINVSQHAHEQKNKNLNDLIIYQRWIVWERDVLYQIHWRTFPLYKQV